MALAHVLSVADLTEAISDENPQGHDIREDRSVTSDYYRIKDARNSARAAERTAVFDDEEVDTISPWLVVAELAPQILSSSAKDLEVCCWYLEALIRLEGIAGLRDGLDLINELIKKYWDVLYPLPDEDGLETKVAPLTGLNGDGGDGTLLTPLRNIMITTDGDYGSFSYWQYSQARDADKIDDDEKKSARIETLGYDLQMILSTVSITTPTTALDFVTAIEQSQEYFKSINNYLRDNCGAEAPPSSNITSLLDEILRTVRYVYKEKLDSLIEEDAAPSDQDNISVEMPSDASLANNIISHDTPHNINGQIISREDALKRLEDIASFFRTYEPHTPLAPALERLVHWGRMPVAELMMELLPDSSARSLYSQLTGVKLDGSDEYKYSPPSSVENVASKAKVDNISSQENEFASKDVDINDVF